MKLVKRQLKLSVAILQIFFAMVAQNTFAKCSDAFEITGSKASGSIQHKTPKQAKPHIIIFSAPSGGGKTTIANILLKSFPNLKISVSTTTRAPRPKEVITKDPQGNPVKTQVLEQDGVDYHFLDIPGFQQKTAKGDFAEWAQVHSNFYGTDALNIQKSFAQGNSVIALIDIKGAAELRKRFPGQVYTIFITPPDMKTLKERLEGRKTDKPEAIALRLKNAQGEMDQAYLFDRIVVNDKLDRAVQELKDLILQEGLVP